MVVKILSFIASVLSNARYKAVLIPCIVVVLSITGLTIVAVFHDNESRTAANTIGTTDKSADQKQQSTSSPQIGGISKQDPKDDIDPDTTPTSKDNTSSTAPPSNTPNTPATPTSASFDFTLNKPAITLSRGATSGLLTATTSDASDIAWTITAENSENGPIEIIAEQTEKDTAPTLSFRLRAAPHAPTGQHQLTITAQDTARAINLSKVIIVTLVL